MFEVQIKVLKRESHLILYYRYVWSLSFVGVGMKNHYFFSALLIQVNIDFIDDLYKTLESLFRTRLNSSGLENQLCGIVLNQYFFG